MTDDLRRMADEAIRRLTAYYSDAVTHLMRPGRMLLDTAKMQSDLEFYRALVSIGQSQT